MEKPAWLSGGRKSFSDEWHPTSDEARAASVDGDALQAVLYDEGFLGSPRAWHTQGTGVLLRGALAELSRLIQRVRDGGTPRICVLDYGTGAGMMPIELLKAMDKGGLLRDIAALNIDFQLKMLDLPSAWFAYAYNVLSECPFAHFYSGRSSAGAILSTEAVIGVEDVDLILASMVFHLIPLKAFDAMVSGLWRTLKVDGRILWNSPDLGPVSASADLFHAANRLTRRRLLQALDRPAVLGEIVAKMPADKAAEFASLEADIRAVSQTLSLEKRQAAEQRANRQILPTPHLLDEIDAKFCKVFAGKTSVDAFEMTQRDGVEILLVPSNQSYLGEIEDVQLRRQFTKCVMNWDVFPSLSRGPAGTANGYMVRWCYGDYRKPQR